MFVTYFWRALITSSQLFQFSLFFEEIIFKDEVNDGQNEESNRATNMRNQKAYNQK